VIDSVDAPGASMTSEPDSTPRRRPPTIDLTATEIKTEQAAEAGETAQAETSSNVHNARHARVDRSRAGGFGPYLVGSLGGAIVLAAIVAGLWFAGVLPARNGAPAPATPGTDASSAISAQLSNIQAALQARPADSALASRVADVEARAKALNDSLAAINRRLDDIAAAAKSADEHAEAAANTANGAVQSASAASNSAKDAVQSANAASNAAKSAAQSATAASNAATGAAQNSVQRSDLDALSARIAALENSIKTLSATTARQTASADDRAARAAVAAEALRAVVERGAPYQAELAAAKSFAPDQNDIAALAPFAATGVPTTAELARELSQLTPSLSNALGPAKSSGSFLGRLEDNARGLVRITPVDAPAGDMPAAVIARLNADAAHNDIAAALTDIALLPASLKPLAASWVQKANARDAAVAASQRIAAAAMASLGNTNAQ
jgi:hypothetical protein